MVLKPGTGESFGKKVWKKIKLHGTQTQSRHHSRFGRRRKLQGSQTWNKSAQTPVQFGRAEEITGFSNIMPFSYPRLIVLEAEEIAWRSNTTVSRATQRFGLGV